MTTIYYTENHHLVSDEGGTNAHIALHLQGVTMRRAVQFVDAVLATARTYHPCAPATHYEPGGVTMTRETAIRPQTSGPCVHLAPVGDDDPEEVAAIGLACGYPAGECPHLDNPDIVCPVRDACYAMRATAPLRETCEAEQGHRDADAATGEPVYETAVPEWVEPEPDDGALHTYTVPATRKPTNPNAWSDEEIEVIRRARNAKEAVTLYYGAYPQSSRTYAAVQSRWYKLREAGKLIEPEPEEPDFTVPHPTYRPGDRVRIKHALHRGQTGEIRRYFPATENYLVAIDGMPDMIVLTDAQMEAV